MDEKAIRGVPWTFLGLGVNKVLATLTTIVLARLVAPSEFGLMAMATIAINFLYWFGGNSFGGAMVVHQELDRRQIGTVLSLSTLGGILAAGICAGASSLAASALHQPRLAGVLVALSSAVVIMGPASFYELLLQRELEFKPRFFAQTTQTVTFTVVAVALAAAGAGVWSLVIGQIACLAAFLVVLLVVAPYRVGFHWDGGVARRVFGTGLGFFSQGVTQFIRQNMDTVLVGRVFSSAAVGFYAMSFRLGDLTYSALTDPLARVTFPAFARSHAQGEDVRPAFFTAVRLVALIAVPVGVLLSAASEPFSLFLFGEEWLPMAAPLTVVGLWAAIRPVEASLSWLLNSLGRAGAVGWVALVVLGPLLVGLIFALDSGHLALVACVPLADTLISLTILMVLARRHADLTPMALWRALRTIAIAATVDWVVTRMLADTLTDAPAFVALAVSGLAGLAFFAVGVTLLEPALPQTALRQVERLRRRGAPAQAAS